MTATGLVALGWDEGWSEAMAAADVAGAAPGRVVRHDQAAVLVGLAEDQRHVHLGGGRRDPLAVGDWVAVAGDVVATILPRRSLLRRQDPMAGGEQLLAANVDLVIIVAGLDRPVKAGRLQRLATLATDAGAEPLVVLTKADLAGDPGAELATAGAALPGVDAVAVAAPGGALGGLEARVRDRTVVLMGESGAGKSTLLNALAGEAVADTGGVRAGDAKGRHTTTARHLHVLPGGGCLIDTPGLRAVGLWVDPEAVTATFADIEDLAPACRFRDCTHDHEPGCAVRAAVADGGLDPGRLAAWAALRHEAEATAARADERARRQAERRGGRMARAAQQLKRGQRR